MPALTRLRPLFLWTEVALMGLIFIQTLQWLVAMLYGRVTSATLVASYPPNSIAPDARGLVDPQLLALELGALAVIFVLPLLTFIIGRWRVSILFAVAITAIGRTLIVNPIAPISPVLAAEITIAGALTYVSILIYQRAVHVPYFFVLGIGGMQIIRALGDTMDVTLLLPDTAYDVGFGLVTIRQLTVIVMSILGFITLLELIATRQTENPENATDMIDPQKGLLTLYSALGMGGLLFLQLALLGLPNAAAARADADYTIFATPIFVATLLPIVPFVRAQIRNVITPFDASTRGWIWLVIIALMLVIATRIQDLFIAGRIFPLGGITIVIAQFTASLIWWWFARPRRGDEVNLGPLWLAVTMLVFALLFVFDIFTYEYAFVRDFAPPLTFLNPVVPSLLRGFEGLGLGLFLFATFLATLPIILASRQIPWMPGKPQQTWLTLLVILIGTGTVLTAVQPPQVSALPLNDVLRVGTYNIHSGYSEFYDYSLVDISRTIQSSGAGVVLLQEVEAGRLTSHSVDQSLWLARQLGMDRRFFATNEGLFGLAVLSRVPIVFDDGALLPSIDQQTGLQRVQIQPDDGPVTIYNTSLGLLLRGPGLQTLEANQQLQLESILDTIAFHIQTDYQGQLGRALLGGTFHNVPGSEIMQQLRDSGFIDPHAGSDESTLQRSNLPPARYDYLWLWSQTLQPVGTNIIASDASDHRMVQAGIRLN